MIGQLQGVSVDTADLVLQIKRQYGDEYGVVVTDADLLQFVYEGEMDIIRSTGGFESKTIAAAASAFPMQIPGTIQVIRVTLNGVALTYISIAELDLVKAALLTAQGAPQYWYNNNEQEIDIFPSVTTDTTANLIVYYKHVAIKKTVPTGALTVPERYHTDLLQFCIARCHNKNRDAQSEQAALTSYNQNLAMRREEGYSFDGPIYKQNDPQDFY
jgi:hypothetical protein